jgi:hypothetical protein
MNKAGATVFIYGLAGYEIKPQQKVNPDILINTTAWGAVRIESKEVRSELTVAIEVLIKYAKDQGASDGVNHYFSTITTNCININLIAAHQFRDSKIKDKRDRMDEKTLTRCKMIETYLANLIYSKIEDGMHYKDIYKVLKAKTYELSHELKIKPVELLEIPVPKLIKQFNKQLELPFTI